MERKEILNEMHGILNNEEHGFGMDINLPFAKRVEITDINTVSIYENVETKVDIAHKLNDIELGIILKLMKNPPIDSSDEEGMKRCRICGRIRPLSEFYKDPKMSDGHQSFCKECSKEKSREYSKRRKEKEQAEKDDNAPKSQNVIIDEKKQTAKKKDDPRDLMLKLASMGYYGVLYHKQHRTETITHNGHTGIFEYDEEMKCDIQKLYEEK